MIMYLKGLLVVFGRYFIDILQVLGQYLENIRNWIRCVKSASGKVSGKCLEGKKEVALGVLQGPVKFKLPGSEI